MGLFFAKTKNVLTAERSTTYIIRRIVIYCRRRAGRLKVRLPIRQRIWTDATFVNKWSTGSRSWITRDTASGDEVQDANKGWIRERFTLLRAFADYVDDDGPHMETFIPGALEWSRGVAVGSSCFLPWFERVLPEGRLLFGCVAFEVHLDNSMAHIYSADSNPRDTRHRRADLLQEAISVCDAMEGEAEDAEIACQLKDCSLDATKKDIVRFPATALGAMVHGILKKAREYGRVVGRTPPYVPEVQPIALDWDSMETAYSARRDNEASVSDFLRDFAIISMKGAS